MWAGVQNAVADQKSLFGIDHLRESTWAAVADGPASCVHSARRMACLASEVARTDAWLENTISRLIDLAVGSI